MNPNGYTAEVIGLSPNASEADVYDFFAFSGAVEHILIVRDGDYGGTAYVTFRDAYALETAVLLSGATIVDHPVCIARWGHYEDEFGVWRTSGSRHLMHENHFVSTPGEAVSVAQEVVKTMLAKGYVLSKDALIKAKAFDESHQVSATAMAKVAELSKRIGLTDKVCEGIDTVKSVDEKYRVSQTTKTVASFTGRAASATAATIVNSSYFAKGALWVSGALTRAAKVAADLGNRGSVK
ncbi:hypothetical protein Syun_016639 [Stephania yunnanensis]|uniref:RRM domain-containing protein n=1 Tax=Stephania yunnanensis TaxID=152371 RepID=A0AAP0J567_9MAGN